MIFPNKDTKVCISISKSPGNFGCFFHNEGYKKLNLNYIYKSFGVDDCKSAISAVRTLNFRGCSITMPFKSDILKYVDELSPEVAKIKAANTILNNRGKLIAYNTDVFAARRKISSLICSNIKKIYILGNGGYSKAVKFAANSLNLNVEKITRVNWDVLFTLQNCFIFNCTPVKDIVSKINKNNLFIDCCTSTETGSNLAFLQGIKQFKIYTGHDYPYSYDAFLQRKEHVNV